MSGPRTPLAILASKPVPANFYEDIAHELDATATAVVRERCLDPQCPDGWVEWSRAQMPILFCSAECEAAYRNQRSDLVGNALTLSVEIDMAKRRGVDKSIIARMQHFHTQIERALAIRYPPIPKLRARDEVTYAAKADASNQPGTRI